MWVEAGGFPPEIDGIRTVLVAMIISSGRPPAVHDGVTGGREVLLAPITTRRALAAGALPGGRDRGVGSVGPGFGGGSPIKARWSLNDLQQRPSALDHRHDPNYRVHRVVATTLDDRYTRIMVAKPRAAGDPSHQNARFARLSAQNP
jgi:hypothetical protein